MRVRCTILSSIATLALCQGALAEYPGWQGLRVIRQEGHPSIMRAADLNADGRAELIVVNSRAARLDIYEWLPEDERPEPESAQPDRPNELPMAREMRHQELQLERPPQDVVTADLDNDGQPELIVLVSTPNQVIVCGRDDAGKLQPQQRYDLLEGDFASRHGAMLIRRVDDGEYQLLVSFRDGIQHLRLRPGGRAEWLTPRERRARIDWWLADLDGDGYEDLIEQTRDAEESIRWYRGSGHSGLMPARGLFDRAVRDAQLFRPQNAVQLLLMDGATQGILRRYDLDVGPPHPLGVRRPLALPDGAKTAWCGLWQGPDRTLVVADPSGPRLLTYTLSDEGWGAQQTYPAVSDIQALAAPAARPGTLLIWANNAADLRTSRYEFERLTYPEPWPQSPEVEDRKILALESVGSTTWWVQRVGKHLDLYVWKPDQEEPTRSRFADVGTKADEVLWNGGRQLLVKDAHARGLKLAVVDEEGNTTVSSPTHLKKASLDEFRLIAVRDELRLARLTDGVLQWIGDDMQSHDQIMLAQGQELADYVADDKSSGWALQKGSPFIHRIEIKPSGLSEAVERVRVADGSGLVRDRVLGLMLVNRDRVTHLSEGRPSELKLVDSVDERVGRGQGIREFNFQRITVTDVDGDGVDDLVLHDDLLHRLIVLADRDGTLQPQIAWPIFDDNVYPYDEEESESLVHEPRVVIGADLDGDEHQDLAMLCHDRLLIYFAREP